MVSGARRAVPEVAAFFIQWQVAELVDDEQPGGDITLERAVEAVVGLGGDQMP